ncbi:MAG: hypothetical protein BECKG1743D_GA0114223_112841, partial [Candidatus Kentron sp. G]
MRCIRVWSGLRTKSPRDRRGGKAISIKEYTNLLVFIVQLLRCNNSY